MTIDQSGGKRGVRLIVLTAAFVIIFWGIIQAQSVLVPLLVSVFLATLGTPAVEWLSRKKIPRIAAVLIVVTGMIVVLLVLGVVVGASMNSFSRSLPSLQVEIEARLSAFADMLAKRGIELPDKSFLKHVNPSSVLGLVSGIFSGLSSALSNTVLILLTVSFILIEASGFSDKIRTAMGKPGASFSSLTRFVDEIKHYTVIKTSLSLAYGVLIWLWLTFLGVKFAVLWGLFAFLLRYVPNIGSILAVIPAVLLVLVEAGPGRAALVAVGYSVIGFVLGNIVEPRIMGRGLGLSTLVVFLSMVFWGSLLGLFGMVLSVPMTMALKLAFESNEKTRWISVLLGPEPSLKNEEDKKQSLDR